MEQKSQRKNQIIGGIICIGLFLISLYSPLIYNSLDIITADNVLIVNGVVLALALTAMFVVCKKFDIEIFAKSKFKWWYLTLGFAVFILNILKMIPLMLIFDQQSTANAEGLLMLAEMNVIYYILYTVIFAPIAEEIVFRGVILKTLFEKKPWIGLLVSSVLFAALHNITDAFSFINYFTIGLLFGGVYMITKDVKWSILAHIINNAIAGLFVLLSILIQ